MQKGFSTLIILLVVLCLALATGGYFYTQKPPTTLTPQPTSYTTPVPTADSTADWKTYTDDRYKFSFSYPPDGFVTFTTSPDDKNNGWVILNSPPDRTGISLLIAPKDVYTTGTAFAAGATIVRKKSTTTIGEVTLPSEEINDKREVTTYVVPLDEKPFSNAESYIVSPLTYKGYEFFIKYKGQSSDLDIEKMKKDMTRILSSFKLPDQDSKTTFCGGIAGIQCPKGYTCKLDGNYPDAGGKCLAF